MVDTGIFATTSEVVRKAGASVSVSSSDSVFVNDFMSQAESEINVATKYNWSDAYSGLDADTKGILKLAASNLAAIFAIQYDMSGYTSRLEAEDMINTLRDSYLRALAILKDKAAQSFLNDPDTGVL